MKLSSNLVPIIKKDKFDDVATEFLKKYCPEALIMPIPIPIEAIAQDKMKLTVEHVNITEDLSIYGQIFFTDGIAEVYIKNSDEYIRQKVKKGTVFIDEDVFFMRNIGCLRNTLTHECVHWFKHRPYHELQTLLGSEMAVACKCPTEEKAERFNREWTDGDWMEWQANGIAPKILMPRDMFCVKADEFFAGSGNLRTIGDRESLINEWVALMLAEFFNVSKQSAAIRLKETGYSSGL